MTKFKMAAVRLLKPFISVERIEIINKYPGFLAGGGGQWSGRTVQCPRPRRGTWVSCPSPEKNRIFVRKCDF